MYMIDPPPPIKKHVVKKISNGQSLKPKKTKIALNQFPIHILNLKPKDTFNTRVNHTDCQFRHSTSKLRQIIIILKLPEITLIVQRRDNKDRPRVHKLSDTKTTPVTISG